MTKCFHKHKPVRNMQNGKLLCGDNYIIGVKFYAKISKVALITKRGWLSYRIACATLSTSYFPDGVAFGRGL